MGNASGTQTLRVHGDGGSGVLAVGSFEIFESGVLELASANAGWEAKVDASSGVTNEGLIHAVTGGHPKRSISGLLLNNGSIAIDHPTEHQGGGKSFLNHGTIAIASGAGLLLTPGSADAGFFQGSTGTLANAGSFRQEGGEFELHGGIATGNPLEVVNAELSVPDGQATIKVMGANELTSDVGAEVKLALDNSPPVGGSVLEVASSQVNKGMITLRTPSGIGNTVLYVVTGAKLTNKGTIRVEAGTNGHLFMWGEIENQKTIDLEQRTTGGHTAKWTNKGTVDIDAAASFDDIGGYTQTSSKRTGSTLKLGLDSDISFGRVRLAPGVGAITIGGIKPSLTIVRLPSYVPALGQTYQILTGGPRTGSFATVSGAKLTGPRYLRPTYSAYDVSLVVTAAKMTNPGSAPRGQSITMGGSDFPPGDTLNLQLRDFAGTTHNLGTAATGDSGAFLKDVIIPGDAATGNGTLIAASTVVVGFKPTKRINIT